MMISNTLASPAQLRNLSATAYQTAAPAVHSPILPARQIAVSKDPSEVIEHPVSRSDIDWAMAIDQKIQQGYIPTPDVQARYDRIVSDLQTIDQSGGKVYQDTVNFSHNPKGFASIGSLVGRTLSGGYVGQLYADDVSLITKNTYTTVKDGVIGGEYGKAFKGFAGGLKDLGVVSLKAGGISSAINATTSMIGNAAGVVSGHQSGREAMANIASDTVGGFLSGVGASTFGGLTSLGIAAAGVTGLPMTIATVTGGIVGSLLIDKAYKGSGLYTLIKRKTIEAID